MGSRKNYGRDAWNKACEAVEKPDGLPTVATKGNWTAHKLYFLCVYLEQVARGMRAHQAFPDGLRYIDLFSGTGVSVVEEEGVPPHPYPGSALIAASLGATAFRGLYLIDEDQDSIAAAKARIAKIGYSGEVRTWCGNVNALIDDVVRAIPPRSLSVAFVDPYSLDVHYETIRQLAAGRSVDLVILFSDRIDLQRNVADTYFPGKNDKLDKFLGGSADWRKRYSGLPNHEGASLRQLFADVYREQLEKLGHKYTKSWPLLGPQGPMFRLVYASKNPLGLKYCEIALTEDFGGQRGLF